ncbi:hypothetical protein AURDEDRAFT_185550 [Auricularia subglabra TFB-10046 SS5]|nr:hypothetical protein AURDEDRAFT_185550 [Auricularia subglabra TFB-10046 SS5]
MSSPVIPRLSSRASLIGNPRHEEELINAYEAEEERIINVLSRKLEQLKEEKIQLENALEAESESHVNRLTRELAALRAQQLHQQQQPHGVSATSTPGSDDGRDLGMNAMLSGADPRYPTHDTLLEAVRRENESLRNRLVDMERDYIKVTRQNEIYREELIDHRRRLGLNVDNLIGMTGDQPLHRRNSSTASSSPTASMVALPARPGLPIPRQPSQIHRPSASAHGLPPMHSPRTPSATTTPLTNSPSSSIPTSPNPYPFSPSTSSHIPASSSYATQITTPPSSTSINGGLAAQVLAGTPIAQPLTYPSVPPPSLSSSLGSPTIPYPPVRLGAQRSHSRHSSVERGGRIAETGTLSRRASIVAAAAARPIPATVVESSGESPPADVLLSP